MDALELLKSDHDTVRKLFGEFEEAQEAEGTSRMATLAQTIMQELETHTAIEEEVLYPEGRLPGMRPKTSSRRGSRSTTSSTC